MKFTSYCILLFLFLIFNSISCRKFCNCDPISIKSIVAKIVNQQGQNLVFGPSAVLNPDSIQVLTQKNNLSTINASVGKRLSDSTLEFDFNRPVEKSYIYYNQQSSSDSMQIKWVTKTGKCCGETYQFSDVDSVFFNKVYIKPVNGILIFRK